MTIYLVIQEFWIDYETYGSSNLAAFNSRELAEKYITYCDVYMIQCRQIVCRYDYSIQEMELLSDDSTFKKSIKCCFCGDNTDNKDEICDECFVSNERYEDEMQSLKETQEDYERQRAEEYQSDILSDYETTNGIIRE